MFGNTFAVLDHSAIVRERIQNPDLYAYLASEYKPADRESIVSALRREAAKGRRRATAHPWTLLGRVGAWVMAAIAPT
jgi:hypothetical protein